ncbi:MAG: phenyltransferase domain-containing protein [Desulfobacterium sp.]|nr:phenyltransferase domain-containing protein [Desulfobacterium sp.]
MEFENFQARSCPTLNIDSVARFIVSLQRESGEIPWHEGGKTDPWDLVESAMGLNVAGFYREADRAFEWMLSNQNADGSWYSSYVEGRPKDRTCETNMSSYIATGVFHHWLIRREMDFIEALWPGVEKGLDFAISLQTERGEIYWAKSPEGDVDPMALLTGSSSIYMSLKCGLSLARLLGKEMPHWERAFEKLGSSIRDNIHIYNISKSRFSMYWFYPVLSGVLTGDAAAKRIERYWKKYVIEDQGVRCVSDRPWVTMAETSELVLAIAGMGKPGLAKIVFSWIQDRVYEDDTFWCGYTFPDMTVWPEEKISWTNAVALMAADALYSITPGSRLFSHDAWDGFRFKG